MMRSVAAIAILWLFVPGSAAWAQLQQPAPPVFMPTQLSISRATAHGLNTASPTFAIEGANFGTVPQVFIGAPGGALVRVPVLSAVDGFIHAQLTEATSAPGAYSVVVTRGPSTTDMSSFVLTI